MLYSDCFVCGAVQRMVTTAYIRLQLERVNRHLVTVRWFTSSGYGTKLHVTCVALHAGYLLPTDRFTVISVVLHI